MTGCYIGCGYLFVILFMLLVVTLIVLSIIFYLRTFWKVWKQPTNHKKTSRLSKESIPLTNVTVVSSQLTEIEKI